MESIESKQALLRKQVLESSIDPEQFIDFLGTLKGQGESVTLDNWSLNELEQAIQQFKKQQAQNKSEVINSRIKDTVKRSKIFDSAKKEKVVYQNYNIWDYEVHEDQECGKAELLFKISDNDSPKVTVQKGQIKSVGGFIFGIGARNQLNLTLSTNFTNNRIIRKGQDVDWLRKVLSTNYPGHYLPPLQLERQLNTDDKTGIEKRKSEIEVFLTKLMSFKTFHYSRHVQAFFQEQNVKKFTEFRNREAFIEISRDIENVETPTGRFRVQISESINKMQKTSTSIAEDMNRLYDDLNHCCCKVITHMQKTDKYVKQLYGITVKLNEKYADSQKLLGMEDYKMPTIFLSFSNIANTTSKNLKRHIKAFYQFYDGYVRSVGKDWEEFIVNDSKVQKQLKRYLNDKSQLLKRKERCANDISRWQLPEAQYMQLRNKDISKMTKEQKIAKMFPSDNQNENRSRLWLAYVNYNYRQSFQAFLVEQQNYLLNKFAQYSGEASVLNQDMIANFKQFNEMIFA